MSLDNNRIKAREQAFFFCFSTEFSQLELDEIIESYSEQEEEPQQFACDLAKGCISKLEQCDKIIEQHLKKNWKLSRIPKVSRTLLRLAVYQLVFDCDNTGAVSPVGVIINDAVRLAKKYATDEDASFVNGVLGSVAKKIENGENLAGESQSNE